MAVDYNYINDSYTRCLTELRERYKGRGIADNAKSEAKLQIKNEAAARNMTPETYVLFDSRSKIADVYRSGEYKGSKYMTSDDFVRYFKSRRAFYTPQLEKEQLPNEADVVNSAVRRNGKGTSRAGLVNSESGGKEGHLQTAISALKVFREKWFPIERREGREEVRGFKFPVPAMTGVAVFAISLGLIVSGSVMVGSASGQVASLNRTIASLEAQQNELQGKLDLKYNIDEIEAEAKSLGMVKRQAVDNEYITLSGEEQIIVFEDGEGENVGLTALLAAFGIKLD